MRLALSLVTFLLLVVPHASAGTIVPLRLAYLNSDLTFGVGSPDHAGWDFEDPMAPTGWFPDGTFAALNAAFVEQTLVTDAGGTVLQSRYLYEGGTFRADFTGVSNGNPVSGSFVAPIISLQIHVDERFAGSPCEGCASVDLFYTLGPGLFDAPVASALGIGRRTLGGDGYGWLLLTDFGNRSGVGGVHSTAERQAWDGWTDLTVTAVVPEPSILALAFVGSFGIWSRRRRVRRS